MGVSVCVCVMCEWPSTCHGRIDEYSQDAGGNYCCAEWYSFRGFFLALAFAAVHLCDRWTLAALWTSTKKRVRSLMGPRGWSAAGSRTKTAPPGWWCCSRPTSLPPTRWSSGWRCTGPAAAPDSWCCRKPSSRSPGQIRSDKIMRQVIRTIEFIDKIWPFLIV